MVIITSFEPYPNSHKQFYNAFIAEARGQSDKIFLKSLGPSLEQALLNLLCLTNVRVGALTRGVPTDFVQVRPLDQNVTKTKGHEDEIGKTIENSIQSLAKERIGAVKLFHQALGHAIDLASEH